MRHARGRRRWLKPGAPPPKPIEPLHTPSRLIPNRRRNMHEAGTACNREVRDCQPGRNWPPAISVRATTTEAASPTPRSPTTIAPPGTSGRSCRANGICSLCHIRRKLRSPKRPGTAMPTIPPARIGIDVGRKLPLEQAITWAASNDVGIIDIQLDTGANVVTSFDPPRAHAIRRSCDHHDIRLGLHTLSAVNVAEYAPLVADAVDAYLHAYIDAAVLLGAEWIVVHAGFHFSADIPQRMQAGLDRLRRVADYAEKKSVLLLLENLNKEPPDAEVHYLAHTIEEWRWFYEKLDLPCPAALLHRQPRPPRPRRRRGFPRRHPPAPRPRSPARGLRQKRQGRTPDSRPGRLRLSGAVQGAGDKRLHRPLHERVRLPRRHADRPRPVCGNGHGLTHCPASKK